jgi:hypothetical protein
MFLKKLNKSNVLRISNKYFIKFIDFKLKNTILLWILNDIIFSFALKIKVNVEKKYI